MSNDKLPDEIELKKDFEKFLALKEKINSQIEYFNKNGAEIGRASCRERV